MRLQHKRQQQLPQVMDQQTEAADLGRLLARVQQTCERTRQELVAVLAAVPNALALLATVPHEVEQATARTLLVAPAPLWMSAKQLAEYWQLVSDEGELMTAGILKWANRVDEEFPLPHARLGDLFRFRREEADSWARAEAERRRSAKAQQLSQKRNQPQLLAKKVSTGTPESL